MSKVTWRGVEEVERNIDAHPDRIEAALWRIAEYWSPQIETYAKENAPWVDRTGNARQSLYAYPKRVGGETRIYISHGRDYGLWLEVANEGKYAILWPAIDAYKQKVWAMVKRVFR